MSNKRFDEEVVVLEMHEHHRTDKALLVSDDGKKKNAVWLPRSQIGIAKTKNPEIVSLTLPEWLAIDKGLV